VPKPKLEGARCLIVIGTEGDGCAALPRRAKAALNDTLEDAFRRRYPGFRLTTGDETVALSA
jgi:hypothetical protein